MNGSETSRRPRTRGGRGTMRVRGGRGRGFYRESSPVASNSTEVVTSSLGGEDVPAVVADPPTRGSRRARAPARGGGTRAVVSAALRGGRGRARGGRGSELVADAAKYFCGIVTKDRVVGVPEGSAIHLPLHKKRPRTWQPGTATLLSTAPRSPSSPVLLIDHENSPRVSLTSSPTGVPSPAAFIDYEMSPITSDGDEAMEESQSRSCPLAETPRRPRTRGGRRGTLRVRGGRGCCFPRGSSPVASNSTEDVARAFVPDPSTRSEESQSRSSPVASNSTEDVVRAFVSHPPVRSEESQSRSSPVASNSSDHDYGVPLKKRKITMGKPTSQPASVLPLREWEIADLVNNDYGSEDDDDYKDDGEDGPIMPIASVLPRTQRAWLDELIEEEEVSQTQSSPQITAMQVLPQHTPSVLQITSPPEVEIPFIIAHPTQLSISQPLSQNIQSGLTEEPHSLWKFDWKTFSEHSVPPPHERMENFDRPTGPVRSFQTPYEVFTAIWDTQILQHIVEQTNAYAQLITARQIEDGTLQHLSRLCKWTDLTIDELQVYFALLMAMGLVYKSNIREYWASQGHVTDTQNYGKYMSVNRFENITRALHFNDNCDPRLHTLAKPQAKLFKIQPILDHLNVKFQELYNLSRDIALDESLTEWKGWLDINQFIKNKSASIGIKSYEVCDSRTGYLWRFKIHAGQEVSEEQDISPVSGVTSKIVLGMVGDLEHRGHVLFMDNYYNSPALTRCLKSKGFDVVGTLRPNRQFVPPEFKMAKTQMKPGDIYGATSGDVDIMVWRDQNKVCMISTYHGMTQFRRDGNQKPSVVHDYNVSMGGVDRKDQMLSMYPIERKRTRVWYKKLFRRLFNVSILNSYIILKQTAHQLQHRQFRKNLIQQLLDVHAPMALMPVQRMRPQPCNFKYSTEVVNHFPTEYGIVPGQTGGKIRIRRSCVKCHARTYMHCPACKFTLCIKRCFVEYHT